LPLEKEQEETFHRDPDAVSVAYQEYITIEWVSPQAILKKVDLNNLDQLEAICEAIRERGSDIEWDRLQMAMEMHAEEQNAESTPEEPEEVTNEDCFEDGTPIIGTNTKKVKPQTEFQVVFLKACKQKNFDNEEQRAQVAKIENAMRKEEREAAKHIGKPPGQ